MTNNEQVFVPADLICDELKPWQRVDNAIRMWVVQSRWEQDLENYQKLKESYE
jgi:hypothetical protein